jgi:hypothetical protein
MLCPMPLSSLWQRVRHLDLEEQILNISAFVAAIGVFFPWAGGQLLGSDTVTYSGLGFYSAFLGIAVLIINVFLILVTFVPLFGGPVLLKKQYKEHIRFFLSMQSTVLILAALSVLMKVTFEFSRMEVRFGVYVSLIASLVVLLYSFLRLQEQRKTSVEQFFRYPDEHAPASEDVMEPSNIPPPPPPLEPEDHHLHNR